jgi:CheY-like chemotaxis protein/anti-sigma regulatory factor (Ser/Thr protein kinase)
MTSLEHVQRTLQALGSTSSVATEIATPLANALDGLMRVRRIVHDLKSFARPDDDTGAMLDLEVVLETAIGQASSEIRPRATLVRDYGDTPRVWATEEKLVRVFVHLLVNAAQAISERRGGQNEIRVSSRTDDRGNARVSIEDTGTGIAREDLDRVFEPFFTNKPGAGTGLGLSICHGIVTSLDGTIEVASEAGRGSTFTVVLPPAPGEHVGRPSRKRPPSVAPKARTRARIFVVDDEERLAQTIALALSAEHDVEYATRGRDAIDELTRDGDYDLVLCDLILPDLGGPEIFEAVRKARPELAKRFVFMTGGAFTERAVAFLKEIDNPRLDKPFPLEDLTSLLERVLSS